MNSTVETIPLNLELDGREHRNLLVRLAETQPAHLVLVFPDWYGRSPVQEIFARKLALAGHASLCVDVYGEGAWLRDPDSAARRMTPLLEDRSALLTRSERLVSLARSAIPATRISAIGFCFGGLCVLDLARSGCLLSVAASFHGVLQPPPFAPAATIQSRIAVFHGWRDPIAPGAGLVRLAEEFEARGASWEIHCYADAVHAFMLPTANTPEAGILHSPDIAERAWETLLRLFKGP